MELFSFPCIVSGSKWGDFLKGLSPCTPWRPLLGWGGISNNVGVTVLLPLPFISYISSSNFHTDLLKFENISLLPIQLPTLPWIPDFKKSLAYFNLKVLGTSQPSPSLSPSPGVPLITIFHSTTCLVSCSQCRECNLSKAVCSQGHTLRFIAMLFLMTSVIGGQVYTHNGGLSHNSGLKPVEAFESLRQIPLERALAENWVAEGEWGNKAAGFGKLLSGRMAKWGLLVKGEMLFCFVQGKVFFSIL